MNTFVSFASEKNRANNRAHNTKVFVLKNAIKMKSIRFGVSITVTNIPNIHHNCLIIQKKLCLK